MSSSFKDLSLLLGKYPTKVICLGGVEYQRIQKAENVLGIKFPDDYREFLRRFGRLNYLGLEFFGLEQHLFDLNQTSCIKSTLFERNIPEFPISYVVVFNSGWEGEVFCLDTNKVINESNPIVNWISGAKPDLQPNEIIASSYIDFIVEYIRQRVEKQDIQDRTG